MGSRGQRSERADWFENQELRQPLVTTLVLTIVSPNNLDPDTKHVHRLTALTLKTANKQADVNRINQKPVLSLSHHGDIINKLKKSK